MQFFLVQPVHGDASKSYRYPTGLFILNVGIGNDIHSLRFTACRQHNLFLPPLSLLDRLCTRIYHLSISIGNGLSKLTYPRRHCERQRSNLKGLPRRFAPRNDYFLLPFPIIAVVGI